MRRPLFLSTGEFEATCRPSQATRRSRNRNSAERNGGRSEHAASRRRDQLPLDPKSSFSQGRDTANAPLAAAGASQLWL